MTADEIKRRKIELGLTNEELSKRSGVPLGTVNKILSGETKAPRRSTLLALESVVAGTENYTYTTAPDIGLFADSGTPYQAGTSPTKKRPGEYTLEDYLALPEDQRVELIDGYFYDMASPHILHQTIAMRIGYQMLNRVEKTKGPCRPLSLPVDVQIDRDDKTVLCPDLIILCDPMVLVKNGRVFGAPDFVIEILSPSTRKRDLTLKLAKYSMAGVRELWYVDPKNLRVLVYDLENEELPVTYTFEDKVPVLIWNSEFSVDFKDVYDYVKDYMD